MDSLRFNPADERERPVPPQDEEWRSIGEDLGVRYAPMVLVALAFATGLAAMAWWTRHAVVLAIAAIATIGARSKTSKT